uniref:Uncharacterized protein n=1 Tax=Compsopogon caeruleus TaxID=31354 RepID=A0A7S1TIB4_9RHOD|mmetsp:Transcript_8446/g.17154  ORF Transcript_8446/g.17154 Transcript_8446/m.17154 type:complete len:283 (+) Transcript_8446:12-860(+)
MESQRSRSLVEKIVGRARSSSRQAQGSDQVDGIVTHGVFSPLQPRRLNVEFTDLDPARWSLELIVLLFNGARKEIRDLNLMMGAMLQRLDRMTDRELRLFFQWWNDFVFYVLEVFKILEEIYFPWFESLFATNSCALPQGTRTELINSIARKSVRVDNCKEQLFTRSIKSFFLIAEAVDDFVTALLDYYRRLELFVSSCGLEAETSKNSIGLLHTVLRDYLLNHNVAQIILPTALRWLSPQDAHQWMETRFSPRIRRFMLPFWQRNFERKHLGQVTQLVGKS